MDESRALLSREWTLSKRWILVVSALVALGYAALFALCEPADRYRLLCDPALVRRVALSGALATGAVLAYRSFVHEIRSGTWDNLLMLPVPRSKVIAVKFAFAAATLLALTVTPMLALWLAVKLARAVGGPVLTLPELAAHSILGRALLVGLSSYSAGAAAALAFRARVFAYWAPLAVPALLYFVTSDENDPNKLTRGAALLLLGCAALALVHAAREAHESGQRSSAKLSTLRATSALPLAMAVLVIGALIGRDMLPRRSFELRTSSDPRVFGVTNDGRIGWHARRRSSSMWSLEARLSARLAPSTQRGRYWAPAIVGASVQYFLDHHRNVLLAYDTQTGREVGCVGRDGPRERDCPEFASRPVILNTTPAFLLERDQIAVFDAQRRTLTVVFRGPVDRVAQTGDDEHTLLVQSGSDLVSLGASVESAADTAESPDDESTSVVRARVLCRGVAMGDELRSVAVEPDFVAMVSGRATSESERWTVCRNGVVSESQEHRDARGLTGVPPRPWRDIVTASLLGPVASIEFRPDRRYSIHGTTHRDRPLDRRPVWITALVTAAVLTAQHWRSRKASAWATGAAVLAGPAFVLAWIVANARRGRRG